MDKITPEIHQCIEVEPEYGQQKIIVRGENLTNKIILKRFYSHEGLVQLLKKTYQGINLDHSKESKFWLTLFNEIQEALKAAQEEKE